MAISPVSCNLLSIDGGGVRGIIPLVVMKKLQDQIGPLTHIFSNIAGTSTGSIIATGITCPTENSTPKYTATELLDLFIDKVSDVFHKTLLQEIESVDGLYGAKYRPDGLENLLVGALENVPLKSALSRLTLPSTGLNHERSFIFSSNKPSTKEIMMRQAVRASAAAPTYFPTYSLKIGDNEIDFADGGIWANNPTLCGYLDMQADFTPQTRSFVLSLGTGATLNTVPVKDKKKGELCWAENILPVMFSSGATATDSFMRALCPGTPLSLANRNYHRIEVIIDAEHDALDDASPENIWYLVDRTESTLDEPKQAEDFEAMCRYLRPKDRS